MIPSKLFLIGFSGSGKSTIGRLLAQRLKYRFVDTDAMIVAQSRMTIPQLFEQKGERTFRSLESKIIAKVCADSRRSVVSLGGGSFLKQRNSVIVMQAGLTIYLRCSLEELVKRTEGDTNRPLLGQSKSPTKLETRRRIQRLLTERLAGYRMADIVFVTTDRTPKQAARELHSRLVMRYGTH